MLYESRYSNLTCCITTYRINEDDRIKGHPCISTCKRGFIALGYGSTPQDAQRDCIGNIDDAEKIHKFETN